MQIILALTVAVATMAVTVSGDIFQDWENRYKSFTCHKGYTGVLKPAYVLAARNCKAAGVDDQYCLRICLWAAIGAFRNGKYNKFAGDSHIANQFDSADNPLIPKWQEDTYQCAQKIGRFPTDFSKGGCEVVKPLLECLVAARSC